MSVSSEFLIKMLLLELKEVENDLNGLKQLYTSRHDSSEITNYVFLENSAVLQAELDSIHKIGELLSELELNSNDTYEEQINTMDLYIQGIIEKRQYSRGVYNFAKSKIVKISKYLDM